MAVFVATTLGFPAFAAPQRVVSTFLCTDEYVFRLLPRERIAALSYEAVDRRPVVSTIADAAAGMPVIRPSAETVLQLKPDLVVMYAGTMVESGPTEELLHRPVHPYTRLLLSAVPDPRAPITVAGADIGEPPRVVDPEPGCRFRWRCPLAIAKCGQVTPVLLPTSPGHQAACHVTAPAAAAA